MAPTHSGLHARSITALAAALLILLALHPARASAKTTTWTDASPAGHLWSDPGNWDNGSPSSSDIVLFSAVGGSSRQDIPGLYLDEMDMSGYTGLLTLDYPLYVGTDLTVDGTLDASFGQVVAAGSIVVQGTLTAPSAIVNVGGDLTVNGTLDAPSAMLDVGGGLTVDGTLDAGGATVSLQGNLEVGGTLDVPDAVITVQGSVTALGWSLLDFGSGALDLFGDLTVAPLSTVKWSGSGTLRFGGSGTQVWTDDSPGLSYGLVVLQQDPSTGHVSLSSALAMQDLVISGGTLDLSGGLIVEGTLTIGPGGALDATSGPPGLTFNFNQVVVNDGRFEIQGSGHTINFVAGASSRLDVNGTGVVTVVGAPGDPIRLQQDGVAGGDRWVLDHEPTTTLTFDHVEVQDSDAQGGTVTATSSTDLGNNLNWDFGARTVTWTGGGASDLWSDAGNWSPGAPSSGDDVRFDPVGGVSIVDLPGLALQTMDMTGFSGALQVPIPLDVLGDVQVSGTLDLDSGTLVVGGDLDVGGTLDAGAGTLTVGGGITVAGTFLGDGGTVVDVYGPMGGSPGATLDMGDATLILRSNTDLRDFTSVSFGPGGRLECPGDIDYRIDFRGTEILPDVDVEPVLTTTIVSFGSANHGVHIGGSLTVGKGTLDLSGAVVTVDGLTDIGIGGRLEGQNQAHTALTLNGHLELAGDFFYSSRNVTVRLYGGNIGGSFHVDGDSAVVGFHAADFTHVLPGGALEVIGGTGVLRGHVELTGLPHVARWNLDIQPGSTTHFENVRVSDSDASSGETATATGDSEDGGNNSNWQFAATGVDDAPPLLLALRAAPNPFSSATTVHYALPRDGAVTIRVFDVGGRVVRTLASGPHATGRYQVTWNGTDDAGRRVGSGAYYIRMRTPSGTLIRDALRVE